MAVQHDPDTGKRLTDRDEGVLCRSSPETDLTLSFFDALEDGVCLVDEDGQVRLINRSMENFFGLSRSDVEGMAISAFTSLVSSRAGQEPGPAMSPDRSGPAVGGQGTGAIRVNSSTEGPIWLEYSSRPLPLSGGRTWRVDLYRRITRWKVTEAHFVESEERYRFLFNKVNDAIFLFALSDDTVPEQLLEVNDVACDLLGYTRRELLALSPLNFIPPAGIGTFLGTLKRLRVDRSIIYESVNIARDGRFIPVETSSHLFSMGGRQVVLSISRDITERQKMEDLKKKALLQINQNIEQFATLSDHIRNPLAVIVGLASLENSRASGRILAAAKEIDGLVLQLDRGWIASENVRAYLRKHCA